MAKAGMPRWIGSVEHAAEALKPSILGTLPLFPVEQCISRTAVSR